MICPIEQVALSINTCFSVALEWTQSGCYTTSPRATRREWIIQLCVCVDKPHNRVVLSSPNEYCLVLRTTCYGLKKNISLLYFFFFFASRSKHEAARVICVAAYNTVGRSNLLRGNIALLSFAEKNRYIVSLKTNGSNTIHV